MLRHKLISLLAILKSKFNIYKAYLKERSENFSEVSFDIVILCILGFLCLYYPVGAWLTNKIDRRIDIETIAAEPSQSQTINSISALINQEVNEKIWTPNLPFFFPAAILDNMPNYQLGIMNALSKFTTTFEKCLDRNFPDKENHSPLYKAAVLLRYPGTVWMFDAQNKIKPVPSASSQYRKARRMLHKYNLLLSANQQDFPQNASDLVLILRKSSLDMAQSNNQLSAIVRENSSSWLDTQADNTFYFNQGKIYAYYQLFKALGQDYKTVIVDNNQYQNWISLTKALEDACLIQPAIIRNGELSSMTAPNHLAYLNSYIFKARNTIEKIISALQHPEKK